MAGKHWYRNYFHNKLYMKLLAIFTLLTIVCIITLSYLLFYFMSQSIVRNELDNQQKAMESVDGLLGRKYEFVQAAVRDIYRNEALSYDMSYFLQHTYEEYVKHRLNRSYESDGFASSNTMNYIKNKLADDRDATFGILYSSEKQFLVAFDQRTGLSKYIATNASRSYIPDVMATEDRPFAAPNVWIRRAVGDTEPNAFAVSVRINDMTTLQAIGRLVVHFDADGIQASLRNHLEPLKGYILVLTPDGKVVFDSSERHYGKTLPYAALAQSGGGGTMRLFGQDAYVSARAGTTNGYLVVGIAPKAEVETSYQRIKRATVAVAALCIVIAVAVSAAFIIQFAKRTRVIIRFMRQVEGGNMRQRLPDEHEDELGQISRSFNQMLDELSRHIDRVYKAEIKQKQAELSALQARVNPHFLYNTLEVIRMRAISQGASDVGDMIYSLATLFKSYVRQRTVHTFKDELEHCRQYLELFRIRYKNKFTYELDWDRELADKPMISMSLQPIIENYVMHGMRPDRDDNRIRVSAKLEDGAMVVRFEDNGSGIEADKLEDIRRRLASQEAEGESFGLRSVAERLRLFYGNDARLDISSTPGAGTAVVVRVPADGTGGRTDV